MLGGSIETLRELDGMSTCHTFSSPTMIVINMVTTKCFVSKFRPSSRTSTESSLDWIFHQEQMTLSVQVQALSDRFKFRLMSHNMTRLDFS